MTESDDQNKCWEYCSFWWLNQERSSWLTKQTHSLTRFDQSSRLWLSEPTQPRSNLVTQADVRQRCRYALLDNCKLTEVILKRGITIAIYHSPSVKILLDVVGWVSRPLIMSRDPLKSAANHELKLPGAGRLTHLFNYALLKAIFKK